MKTTSIILMALWASIISYYTGRGMEIHITQQKTESCLRQIGPTVKSVNVREFFGLPKEYSKPSYNAVRGFIALKMEDCELGR